MLLVVPGRFMNPGGGAGLVPRLAVCCSLSEALDVANTLTSLAGQLGRKSGTHLYNILRSSPHM